MFRWLEILRAAPPLEAIRRADGAVADAKNEALAATAVALAQEAVDLCLWLDGPDEPRTWRAMRTLGRALIAHDDHIQALTLLDETAARSAAIARPWSKTVVTTRQTAALAAKSAGRYQDYADRTFAILETAQSAPFPNEDTVILTWSFHLAAWNALGRHADVLEALTRLGFPDRVPSDNAVAARSNLFQVQGRAHTELGDHLAAEQSHLANLTHWRTHPGNPDMLIDATDRLAVTFLAQGRTTEAEAMASANLQDALARWGPTGRPANRVTSTLAEIHLALGRLPEAEAESEAVLAHTRTRLGDDHPVTLRQRFLRARVAAALGADPTAEHRAIYETRLAMFGPDHPATLESRAATGLA